jgi:hypothetical protein
MKKRWSRRPVHWLVVAAVLTLTAAGLSACTGAAGVAPQAPSATASPIVGSPGGTPESGTKMAPGLYDQSDGTVVAVGTVEYRDLEGGFWAVVGGTEAAGDQGTVVAVIANGDEFAQQFKANQGYSFVIHGERADDVSTRMAGPEITATRVELASEASPAE